MENKFKIGIRAHDLNNAPFNNAVDLIDELKKENIKYIQLVYKKAFKNFVMDFDFLKEVNKKFKENGIEVAMIGAYFNMVHPDDVKVQDGIEFFKKCLDSAYIFNCMYVGSETGSLNGDEWTYNENNKNDDTFNKANEAIKELLEYSNNLNVGPIIEGAYSHTMYEPERLYQAVENLGIENITFDLFNYLNINNYMNHLDIFYKGVKLFKEKIKVFHIKDFIVKDNKLVQVPIGKGLIQYDEILKVIKEKYKDSYLILEEVTGENIKTSIEFIRSHE